MNNSNTSRRQKLTNLAIKVLTYIGAALVYFFVFSIFFDTPTEYELRHSTDRLRNEYEALERSYDSLEVVLENVSERERNIFAMMFEAEPYDLSSEDKIERLELHEALLEESTSSLRTELEERVNRVDESVRVLEKSYNTIQEKLKELGSESDYIPSIQPVINNQLTLLTASYGMLMHPFYRTLQSHQGVDYTIPEGSHVFATADGVVKEVSGKNSTNGLTVIIDHQNGYQTLYSHLQSIKVHKGSKVKRGDIIAFSGNSGLSLAPHLHYEVRYNGMRVDPIHYFFMELTPDEYQRIIRISQSGMQSFD